MKWNRKIKNKGNLVTALCVTKRYSNSSEKNNFLLACLLEHNFTPNSQSFSTICTLLGMNLLSNAFSSHHKCSIGLNSGEYGDKYTTLAPTPSIISSTPSTLCTLRLSIPTTAPFHNFGASSSCTNFKNSSPFIDFTIVFIAITFFWLIAPITVTLLPL